MFCFIVIVDTLDRYQPFSVSPFRSMMNPHKANCAPPTCLSGRLIAHNTQYKPLTSSPYHATISGISGCLVCICKQADLHIKDLELLVPPLG